MLRLVIIVIMALLSGCNNDDTTQNIIPENSISGAYRGYFFNDSGGLYSSLALISEDNIMRLVSSRLGGQAVGQITKIDKSYSASLAHYRNPLGNDTFSTKSSDNVELALNITNVEITGTWRISTYSGKLNLQKLNGLKIDINQLSSNWYINTATSSGTTYSLAISIDIQGLITGSDTTGCTLLGNVVDPAQVAPVIPLNLNLSSCGSNDGQYQGLMTIIFSDYLQMSLSNNTHALTAVLNR